jgi:hypothetical protein
VQGLAGLVERLVGREEGARLEVGVQVLSGHLHEAAAARRDCQLGLAVVLYLARQGEFEPRVAVRVGRAARLQDDGLVAVA